MVNLFSKNKDLIFYDLYAIFLNGSILAAIFYKIKQINFFVNFLKNEYFLLIAGFISMILYMYGVILSSSSHNPIKTKNDTFCLCFSSKTYRTHT